MPIPVTIPRYHSKDFTVLALSMLPMAVMLNYLLYGRQLFSNGILFSVTLLITFAYLAIVFTSCGLVAISLRDRLPSDRDIFKRILLCLATFYLMSAAFISILLLIYDATHLFNYRYRESDFFQAYIAAVAINTFLTFFNEGIYRFEKLKETVTQTERLKKEYMQSRLLGLKSQMNPHFLFNSLNTLSCLIHENSDEAEEFLDHMSKVYRYLLRHRDEKLVTLETELRFIQSYSYILKRRYNEGFILSVNVSLEWMDKMIAPLSLQMIIENAANRNTVSRDFPLVMSVGIVEGKLHVSNSIHCRVNPPEDNLALENIASKYHLLCGEEIKINETAAGRTIVLPLIPAAENIVA